MVQFSAKVKPPVEVLPTIRELAIVHACQRVASRKNNQGHAKIGLGLLTMRQFSHVMTTSDGMG